MALKSARLSRCQKGRTQPDVVNGDAIHCVFVLYVRILCKLGSTDFMTATIRDNLRYWRTSLADGALGEGKLRNLTVSDLWMSL